MRPYLEKTLHKKRAGEVAQGEALGSNRSATKKQNNLSQNSSEQKCAGRHLAGLLSWEFSSCGELSSFTAPACNSP
jgi:hypothetical protein